MSDDPGLRRQATPNHFYDLPEEVRRHIERIANAEWLKDSLLLSRCPRACVATPCRYGARPVRYWMYELFPMLEDLAMCLAMTNPAKIAIHNAMYHPTGPDTTWHRLSPPEAQRNFARYKPEIVALHHWLQALDLETRSTHFDTPWGLNELLERAPMVHRWHYVRLKREQMRRVHRENVERAAHAANILQMRSNGYVSHADLRWLSRVCPRLFNRSALTAKC